MKARALIAATVAVATVVLFQNCAESSFSQREGSFQSKGEGPELLRAPQSQSIYVGDLAIFDVDVSAVQAVTYQWFKNGRAIGYETTPELRISNATKQDAAYYEVEINVDGSYFDRIGAELEVLSCQANEEVSCSSAEGGGTKTCRSDGSGFGACSGGSSGSGSNSNAKSCKLPWGSNLGHGKSVRAYKDSSSFSCTSETRKCTDGKLSGNYKHSSCKQKYKYSRISATNSTYTEPGWYRGRPTCSSKVKSGKECSAAQRYKECVKKFDCFGTHFTFVNGVRNPGKACRYERYRCK